MERAARWLGSLSSISRRMRWRGTIAGDFLPTILARSKQWEPGCSIWRLNRTSARFGSSGKRKWRWNHETHSSNSCLYRRALRKLRLRDHPAASLCDFRRGRADCRRHRDLSRRQVVSDEEHAVVPRIVREAVLNQQKALSRAFD